MSQSPLTPEKFLTDFLKDCVAMPGNRKELIAGYAKTIESMLAAAVKLSKENE